MKPEKNDLMSTPKSERELAFLRDLYIAPDWGTRFAELIDENVKLPKKGRILYMGSGTGAHALSLLENASKDISLVCVDEREQSLELARAKAQVLNVQPTFLREQLDALSFGDEEFDLVVCDASLESSDKLPEIVSELVRVTATGGTAAIGLTTASSFGEFFSIYWEALLNLGLDDQTHSVESLISELPKVAELERLASESGLEEVVSWTTNEEFTYPSGKEFIESPLIADFLLNRWVEELPDAAARESLCGEIVRIIDEERTDLDFVLSVKATLLAGRKTE
jgi:ubiquinone/menaquinone biosynthesis C-methylase UbiE